MDRDVVVLILVIGHGILGSNHKERYGGDCMEVVKEVDGRWGKRIDDEGERDGMERPSIAA